MTQPIGNGPITNNARATPIRDLPPFFGIAIEAEAEDVTNPKPVSSWVGSVPGKPEDLITLNPNEDNSGVVYIGGATTQQVPLTGPFLIAYKDLSYAYLKFTSAGDIVYATKGASAGPAAAAQSATLSGPVLFNSNGSQVSSPASYSPGTHLATSGTAAPVSGTLLLDIVNPSGAAGMVVEILIQAPNGDVVSSLIPYNNGNAIPASSGVEYTLNVTKGYYYYLYFAWLSGGPSAAYRGIDGTIT